MIRRPRMKTKKIMTVLVGATFGLLLLLVSPETSQAVFFDLTTVGEFDSGDFVSDSVTDTATGLTLTLTALSDVPVTQNLPADPGSYVGHVHIGGSGAGVWGWDKNKLEWRGSDGISGKGQFDDEVLILTFSTDVTTSSIQLTLTGYDKANDEVLIYLDQYLPPINLSPVASEGDFLGAPASGVWGLDFSTSTATSLPESFTTMYVMNTHVGTGSGEEFLYLLNKSG